MCNKQCSVDGCQRDSLARGYCSTHYKRFRLHGSPTGGREPRGDHAGSRRGYYNDVILQYEGDECLIWPFRRRPDTGYASWGRSSKGTYLVSRMVCQTVFGPPPFENAEAAHSCGNGHLGCVTKRHLRWATPSENAGDKLLHGTDNRGERNTSAKLNAGEVMEIRRLSATYSQTALAEMFRVRQATISQIVARKRWSWLK